MKASSLICIALSVGLLIACRHYTGVQAAFVHAHGANLAFSFGAVFLVRLLPLPGMQTAWRPAGVALLGVWAQETLQAARLYPGTFDPWDYLFDAGGVAVALAFAVVVRGLARRRKPQENRPRSAGT